GEVLLIRNLPFARPLPTRPQPSIRRLPSTARSLLEKAKRPVRQTHRAFCSGDVLLSHDLSSHYHRGCSVSLPCSEWERVGPLRDNHQSAKPRGRFAATAARQGRSRTLGTTFQFPKNMNSGRNPRSEIRS